MSAPGDVAGDHYDPPVRGRRKGGRGHGVEEHNTVDVATPVRFRLRSPLFFKGLAYMAGPLILGQTGFGNIFGNRNLIGEGGALGPVPGVLSHKWRWRG